MSCVEKNNGCHCVRVVWGRAMTGSVLFSFVLLQTSTPSVKLTVSALGREAPAADTTSTVTAAMFFCSFHTENLKWLG